MSNLTEEEFLETYGEAMVVFTSYYKYSFSFTGEFNGKSIYVSVGGSAGDIYKFDVDAGKKYAVKQLDINYGVVRDGETIIAEYVNPW